MGGFNSCHWVIKGNFIETNNQGWKSRSQKGAEDSGLMVTSYVCFELGEDFIHGSEVGMLSLTNQVLSLREVAAELLKDDQKVIQHLPRDSSLIYLQACKHASWIFVNWSR